MKQKLLILGAVFFGILAAVLTWAQLNEANAARASQMEEVSVVEVVERLMPGVTIQKADLVPRRVQRLRNDQRKSREVPAEQITRVVGKKVRNEVTPGTLLLWSDLESEYDPYAGFSSKIPANANVRAVTISVDAVSSVAGLIKPGDHVDLVGTFRFPDLKGDQAMDTITLTLLQNVIVLATGTDYGQNLNSVSRGYNTMTLQLSPSEAEVIIFATQKGAKLVCTLRNPQETKNTSDLNNVNWNYIQQNLKDFAARREAMSKGLYLR